MYTPPINHNYGTQSDVDSQAGKGKSLKIPGVGYGWSPVDSVIFHDDTEWVPVKIGIAHGSEAQAVERSAGAATDQGSDQHYHFITPVYSCKRWEDFIGNYLRDLGYSTKHGFDSQLSDYHKQFYVRQTGGKEWFVLPLSVLKEALRLADEFMARGGKKPTRLDPFYGNSKREKYEWIGETYSNPAATFKINSYGDPVADMSDRLGGPIKNKKLEFAFMMRRMTGIAPKGCKSQDARYRHEFI